MKHKSKIRIVLAYGFYLCLFFAMQSAWPNKGGTEVKPNLLFVLAVLSGYQFGFADGLAIGLLGGFLQDFYSGRGIGTGMLLFMIAAISSTRLFKRKLMRSILPALLSTAICTVFYEISVRVILRLSILVQDIPTGRMDIGILLNDILSAVFWNLVIMVPMFILLRYFGPYKRRPELGHVEREGRSAGW